jgi:hypothetical protein
MEDLPPQCPPNDSLDTAWPSIFRLIDSPHPGSNAFKSQAALGEVPPPAVDDCRWASCSLVFDAKKQKKYPKFKRTHHWAAQLAIPQGAGRSKQTSSNHVDFWCGNHFDMFGAVVAVVSI